MYIKIAIMPKDAILDPQGKAIVQALKSLGFTTVEEARMGRMIDIEYEEKDAAQARLDADEIVRKSSFFNPVMESYHIEIVDIPKIESEIAIPKPPIRSPRPSPPIREEWKPVSPKEFYIILGVAAACIVAGALIVLL